MRPTMQFSAKLDIKLINHVRENPVLYDNSNPLYIDFNEREVVWQKIGDELRRPASDCKARWINIRDIYRRIFKKRSSSSDKRPRKYKYDSHLAFIKPFFRELTFTTDFEEDDGEDDNDQTNSVINEETMMNDEFSNESNDEKPVIHFRKRKSSLKLKEKRKKRNYVEDTGASTTSVVELANTASELDSSDPIDAFLMSVGATLRTLSPYHLNLAKSKIFAVVQELELKQIVERQNPDIQLHNVKLDAIS